MAMIDIYDIKKNKVGEMTLDDAVFNSDVKEYLIHEAVKVQLANRRAGTVAVKNRSAVSGGGKKPYRQKGTGQARQGCIRAPHFVGGGVAFGPQPKVYNLSMNKKARKGAVKSALSMLYKGNKLSVVNSFDLSCISTKLFVGVLKAFDIDKTLVVLDSPNANLELSARNVKHVKVVKAEQLSVYDIVRYNNIILTEAAVRTVEGVLQS